MLRWGLVLLIAPLLLLMGVYWHEFGSVNECILQGGQYDYRLHECTFAVTMPFVPYAERYPLLVNLSMLAALAGFVLCLVGLYSRRR